MTAVAVVATLARGALGDPLLRRRLGSLARERRLRPERVALHDRHLAADRPLDVAQVRALVRVARASNVLILVIALAIMTQLTSINQAWQITLLFGAGLGVVQVLRWIWWRMNAWAEIAAMLVSSAAAPVLMVFLDDDQQALRLLLAAAVSTAAALAAIWFKGPEDPRQLSAFYERVRPVGFWGPVARAAGVGADVGPQRLRRALGATALCSLSIFCLLVGIGTWLVGSPPPVWLPSRSVWIGVLLVVGLGLCPVWYRLGYPTTQPPQRSH